MRWIVLAGLVACGAEGDDTGPAPEGLVEVFPVDCSYAPGGDGKVRVAELLDGPVAIVQYEYCRPGDECLRYNGGFGEPVIYSDADGSIWFDPVDCGNYGITRVFVIR